MNFAKSRFCPSLCVLGCLFFSALSSAQEQPTELDDLVETVKEQLPFLGRGTVSFYLENDMFTDTDQNYTNGVRVSLSSPNLLRFDEAFIKNDQFRDWYEWLNARLEFFHPSPPEGVEDTALRSRRVVLTLGQQIYTPSDRDATELVEDERPYAGWLYMGTFFHARLGDQLKTIGLNVGLVGPASLGEESQDLIHDIRDIEKFKGWDNQLDNELGLQLVFEKKDKLFKQTQNDFGYDFISHYGASVGNVATYVNFGGEFRLGWHVPDDFGTSTLRSGADNHTPDGVSPNDWGFHGFISADGRYVLRDIFLDGNTFSDSHSVEKEPWVADAALGVSLTYKQVKFSYARILRTREYVKQENSHRYGSLSLSVDYQF